jgi:hypothetical protein
MGIKNHSFPEWLLISLMVAVHHEEEEDYIRYLIVGQGWGTQNLNGMMEKMRDEDDC